jgi:hypothetical protein
LKSLRITPLQFDILNIRVEKHIETLEGATQIAPFSFWGGLMARAKAEGEVESEESEPEE